MPIILVFTKANDLSLAKEVEEDLRKKNIDNSFVTVIAEDMSLTDGTIKKAFGKEELIKTTLAKCTKILGSDMLKIMIQLISTSIKEKLIKENEKIMNEIKIKTLNDFFEDYKDVLKDGDFIKYINEIFFKYLNYFFDKNKTISNKSKNLIFNSAFISSIKNIYSSSKFGIKEIIKPLAEEKSKELINDQAIIEKNSANMYLINKRNLSEFQKTTEIFLKRNYYFIVQNYIIFYIIEKSHIHFIKFLSLLFSEFNIIIQKLTNLNNDDMDCILIKSFLEACFRRKVKSFSYNNNIIALTIQEESQMFSPIISDFIQDRNIQDEQISILKNSDSFLFNKKEFEIYNEIEEININDNWFKLSDNNWKSLDEELKIKINNILMEIKIQDNIFDFNNGDISF